jgi:hypothetical protein
MYTVFQLKQIKLKPKILGLFYSMEGHTWQWRSLGILMDVRAGWFFQNNS